MKIGLRSPAGLLGMDYSGRKSSVLDLDSPPRISPESKNPNHNSTLCMDRAIQAVGKKIIADQIVLLKFSEFLKTFTSKDSSQI